MNAAETGKDISIAADHGTICAYLFGSRARGDNKESSDFDLCIDVPKECGLFDDRVILYGPKEALGKDVDIVCEDNAMKKPSLMERILRDRKILFESGC